MSHIKVGIAGVGGVGLAYAAWFSSKNIDVKVWSPRSQSAQVFQSHTLTATGVVAGEYKVGYAESARHLADYADVIIMAVPLNGHRFVMDSLLPHLRSGHVVIVSAMACLSSLYIYERATALGVDVTVASVGTTAFTARRKTPAQVDVMTKRPKLGVSCLPQSTSEYARQVCGKLFACEVSIDKNPLMSSLSNTSAVGHVPLALFNWTRIERAEEWPQYHYMTPDVANIINKLDLERIAVAKVFGWDLPKFEQKLRNSFDVAASGLPSVAAELHRKRGGPPGPTSVDTRYLWEDVPYGLIFMAAIGKIAGIAMPVTDTMVAVSALIAGEDLLNANDLLEGLDLSGETVDGLLERVNASFN